MLGAGTGGMLSNYQQSWEHSNKNRQLKPARVNQQQQQIVHRQQAQMQQIQQQVQFPEHQYQQLGHHQQQQQNYLTKIERARESDEKQQDRNQFAATRQLGAIGLDERSRQIEGLKSSQQQVKMSFYFIRNI